MATKREQEMQSQIDVLQSQIRGLMAYFGVPEGRESAERPEDRADYIKHGSDEHAVFLGLIPADGDDPDAMEDQREDHTGQHWKLADMTMFGPHVRKEYLREVLRQKVSVLASTLPEPQNVDPRLPHYAPAMWIPKDRKPAPAQ